MSERDVIEDLGHGVRLVEDEDETVLELDGEDLWRDGCHEPEDMSLGRDLRCFVVALARLAAQRDEARAKVTALRQAWAPRCDKRCAETAMVNEDAFEHVTTCAAYAPGIDDAAEALRARAEAAEAALAALREATIGAMRCACSLPADECAAMRPPPPPEAVPPSPSPARARAPRCS
jgi:hypothetical protein